MWWLGTEEQCGACVPRDSLPTGLNHASKFTQRADRAVSDAGSGERVRGAVEGLYAHQSPGQEGGGRRKGARGEGEGEERGAGGQAGCQRERPRGAGCKARAAPGPLASARC
eukprot:2093952-Rhodomonas_salina.3